MSIHSWLLRDPVHGHGIWIKQGNMGVMRPFLASLGSQGLLSMENRLWKSCDILKLNQPFLKCRVTTVLLFRVIDWFVLCIALQGQICLARTGLPEFRVTWSFCHSCYNFFRMLPCQTGEGQGRKGILVMPAGSKILGEINLLRGEEKEQPIPSDL